MGMNVKEITAGQSSKIFDAASGNGTTYLTPAAKLGIYIDLTATAQVQIQVSNDDVTWFAHPDYTTAKTVDFVGIHDCPFKYIRAVITTGTGATGVWMSW